MVCGHESVSDRPDENIYIQFPVLYHESGILRMTFKSLDYHRPKNLLTASTRLLTCNFSYIWYTCFLTVSGLRYS